MKKSSATKTQELDIPSVSEQDGVRYLHFDSPWVQGAMDIDKPVTLTLSYTQQMMAWLLFLEPALDRSIGQLGLGAGSLTRFCNKHLPNPQVVVERNPAVIALCQHYFKLPTNRRLNVVQADAQAWVGNPENRASLAVLMVDLYDTQAQGPVCGSLSFYQDCERVLEPPGILSVNLFGHHKSFADNLMSLRAVFGERLLVLPPLPEGNQIVLAFKGPMARFNRLDLFERADWLENNFQLPARRWVRAMGKMTSI
jgi:spermidine synthase